MRNRLRFAAAVTILLGATIALRGQAAPPASQGQPRDTGPSVSFAEDFVIGPQDVLGILFWRDEEMSGDVTVRPDGQITLPLVGDMQAAGLKPEALKDVIQKAATKFIEDPTVTVIVRAINSRKVFITGEVAMSGEYPLTGPLTVMQLISLAGGITEFAHEEDISILRLVNGRTQSFRFNYKEVARGQRLDQNRLLMPGDTVTVP